MRAGIAESEVTVDGAYTLFVADFSDLAGFPTYALVGELALGRQLTREPLPRPSFPGPLRVQAARNWRWRAAFHRDYAKRHTAHGTRLAATRVPLPLCAPAPTWKKRTPGWRTAANGCSTRRACWPARACTRPDRAIRVVSCDRPNLPDSGACNGKSTGRGGNGRSERVAVRDQRLCLRHRTGWWGGRCFSRRSRRTRGAVGRGPGQAAGRCASTTAPDPAPPTRAGDR